jgi:curli biogenesis system outer membrane secretion channel CsgG
LIENAAHFPPPLLKENAPMKNVILQKALLTLAAACFAVSVASAQTDKTTLAVSTIKAGPALTAAMAKSGKTASLARVTEALDSQLIDRLMATRKFDLVGRSDLKDVLKEQELANSGNVNPNDPNAARAGQLAGAKLILTTTLDDFEDTTSRVELTTLQRTATVRKIRLTAAARLVDATTGKIVDSSTVQLEAKDDRMDQAGIQRNAELTDSALITLAREAAEKIANRMADAAFPVRVLVKRDKQITINRGDGAGVAVGQLWNVFALGEELVDPDTKEVLGREEVLVGKARIVSVQAKFSTAELLDDAGIDKGAVLRRAPEPQ